MAEVLTRAYGDSCSRCTGYRPILDAFKVFAKVEPGAYTEEAIAASKGAANGAVNGDVANGAVNGAKAPKANGKVARHSTAVLSLL